MLLQDKQNILVDKGYVNYGEELVYLLKSEKLLPMEIDLIINTHTHFDHIYNNYLFKKAEIINGRSIWKPDG